LSNKYFSISFKLDGMLAGCAGQQPADWGNYIIVLYFRTAEYGRISRETQVLFTLLPPSLMTLSRYHVFGHIHQQHGCTTNG
jgi:hypothetical protein